MLSYSHRVRTSQTDASELTAFALGLVALAGAATLSHFRSPLTITNKNPQGRFDPVTQADRAAEQIIREEIERAYPDHGIFGEEFGHKKGNGLTWVVDPIDGTRAFMSGMLHWGVLLALFDGERPVLGVMHQPFTGEFFYGDNESANYRRGDAVRPLRVRPCGSLADAVLTTTSPGLFRGPGERAAFDRVEQAVQLSKYGGDCYIYAMLAMGFVDVDTDAGLKPYDIQALMPIIRGAGGVVTTIDGGNASMGGLVVASGSVGLHEQVLACMKGED